MAGLRESLDEIQNNPITVNDAEFDDRVRSVKEDVDSLVTKAGQKFGKYKIFYFVKFFIARSHFN